MLSHSIEDDALILQLTYWADNSLTSWAVCAEVLFKFYSDNMLHFNFLRELPPDWLFLNYKSDIIVYKKIQTIGKVIKT